jgi:hypothetical protein
MNKKELKIKEERTLQAIRKNLMGPSGKLGIIAQTLGKKIIAHGSDTANYLPDFWELPDEETILIEDDPYLDAIGWIWDGLNRGLHMEIKVDNYKREIKATYKGYSVYTEVAGDLKLYAPIHPIAGEWEQHIDGLYKTAKQRMSKRKLEKEEDRKQASPGLARKILNMLRMRWGD